jgi:hypothetical protein
MVKFSSSSSARCRANQHHDRVSRQCRQVTMNAGEFHILVSNLLQAAVFIKVSIVREASCGGSLTPQPRLCRAKPETGPLLPQSSTRFLCLLVSMKFSASRSKAHPALINPNIIFTEVTYCVFSLFKQRLCSLAQEKYDICHRRFNPVRSVYSE